MPPVPPCSAAAPRGTLPPPCGSGRGFSCSPRTAALPWSPPAVGPAWAGGMGKGHLPLSWLLAACSRWQTPSSHVCKSTASTFLVFPDSSGSSGPFRESLVELSSCLPQRPELVWGPGASLVSPLHGPHLVPTPTSLRGARGHLSSSWSGLFGTHNPFSSSRD